MKTNSYIYILTNEYNTVFYIGVTSDLIKRVWEHKNKEVKGFSKTYGLNKLVYYEVIDSVELAIAREKQLKRWHRKWKLNLITESNPEFKDLYEEVLG
jgi:putative endonuclease